MINPHVDRTATANKTRIDLVESEFTSVLRGEFEIEEIIAAKAVKIVLIMGFNGITCPKPVWKRRNAHLTHSLREQAQVSGAVLNLPHKSGL